MSKNHLRSALASALAALQAGCGGSDAPPPADPLARYQNQTVEWNDCSAYLEQDPEGYARKLGPRLQCAQVQVPQAMVARASLTVPMVEVSLSPSDLDFPNPERGFYRLRPTPPRSPPPRSPMWWKTASGSFTPRAI
jgi:hypothetical protein